MGLLDAPVTPERVVGTSRAGRAAMRGRNILAQTPMRPLQRMVYPPDDAPTVTLTDNPTNSVLLGSAIITGVTFNGLDVIANQMVNVFGCSNTRHVTGSFPAGIVYKNICKQKDLLGTNQIIGYSLHFWSDSDKLELIWQNGGAGSYRVWVDDQVIGSATPTTFAVTSPVGSLQSLTIDHTRGGTVTPTANKPYRYRIDLYNALFVGMFVNSSATPKKYSIWRAAQRGPTALFAGDSFQGGSGMSTSAIAQIPNYFCDVLGWDNCWNQAQGGTGYNVHNAPSSFNNASLAQITYLAPSASAPTDTTPGNTVPVFDFVFLAWGHNDAITWNSTTDAQAAATIAAVRSQWPHAFVVLAGPFFDGTIGTSFNTIETALFAANAHLADMTISSLQGLNRPWLTGSGNTGATTGSGNGDFAIGSDTVHPTDDGIRLIAERLVPEILTGLAA